MLRFLALTLLAYLPNAGEVYLLEEPENGVHPLALDAVYDSIASVHASQVLVATQSAALLKLAEPDEVLCFATTTTAPRTSFAGMTIPIFMTGTARPKRICCSLPV